MLLKAGVMKSTVFALIATFLLLCPAGFAEKSAAQTVIAAVAAPPGPPLGPLERNLARNPDELDVFYQDPGGALAMNWAVGPWNTPSRITPAGAGRPNTPIAAAINNRGFLQAFYAQPDGAIGSAMSVRVGRREASAITQPGLVRGDSPLAVLRLGSDIWVFFVAPNGSVASMMAGPVTGTADHVWPLVFAGAGSAGNGTGLVAVLRREEWHMFFQAVTGALVDVRYLPYGSVPRSVSSISKEGVQPPVQIAPPGVASPQGPIAVLARGTDQLHLFFVRPDGAVATTWMDDQHSWAAPFPITPPGAARADSPLAAVVRGGDQLHVFYVGPDGAVATTWAVGPWQRPFPITPPGAAGPGSRLGALLRRDQLHVFYQGADGALATTWAVGPWQTPFPITPPGAGRPGSSIAVVTGR
jgi:hypothetical protein